MSTAPLRCVICGHSSPKDPNLYWHVFYEFWDACRTVLGYGYILVGMPIQGLQVAWIGMTAGDDSPIMGVAGIAGGIVTLFVWDHIIARWLDEP